MMVTAIILSGGTGSRMGLNIPKQYMRICDKMIITYALTPFIEEPDITSIQIVCESNYRDMILEDVGDSAGIVLGFSLPGQTRQLSIYNALKDISDNMMPDDIVIIHDAARPNVSSEMIRACIRACEHCDGALPVIPMKDTVYYSEKGDRADKLIPRSKLFAGQAPEAFKFGKYLSACESLLPDDILGINGSSEPAIIAGMDIAMIPGDERNYKITTPEDLERYRNSMV